MTAATLSSLFHARLGQGSPFLVLALVGALRAQTEGGAASRATAEPQAERPDWIGGNDFASWAKLTGDWGGLRTSLEERGIEFNGGYTLDWTAVWNGGVTERSTARSLVDVNVMLRTEKLLGLPGGSLYADVYDIVGRNGGTDTGSIYGISNIDGASPIQLAELWYEHKLFEERLRLKVGKIDANSEFALQSLNADFLHTAGAAAPTIVSFPTYPNPAMGALAFVYPSAKCYLGAGIFDGSLAVGVPTGSRGPKTFFDQPSGSGHFWIGEGGWQWAADQGSWGRGRLAAGIWGHSADFSTFAGGTESGTSGQYLFLEQQVWKENTEDDQGLALTAMVSRADEEVAAVKLAWQISGTYTGLLSSRPNDACGLMFNHFDLSDDSNAGFPKDESAFELFYRIQVTPFLKITPDLQWILNPAGDPTIDDAFVGGVRFDLIF